MKGLLDWMVAEQDRDPSRIRDRVFAPVTRAEALVVLCIGIILVAALRYDGSGIDWEIFAGAADGQWESEFGLGYYYAYWLLPIFDAYDSLGIVGQLLWSATNVAGAWFAARVFGSRPAVVLAGFGALTAFYTGTITGVALGALAGIYWSCMSGQWVLAGGLTLLSLAKPQWGVVLTLLVVVNAAPRIRDLAKMAIVPVPAVIGSFIYWGWWPGDILERASDNPPVGNSSLWSYIGPIAIVLWLPVLLPMDKQRRVALAAATAMMAVPYVQHYDYMVVWVMTADGLGLVSHLYGLFFTFVGERATKGILIIPMLGAWALLAREPVVTAWSRVRSAVAERRSVEQPA
ncbi:MAG: hypothetical protein AAF480_06075 [Actinomycetota bacterium]